ncbi:hypothetical protein C9994_07805 [Marivirga lumbricoides]|uniref:Uncharacterized protein n=1 Tax=Marivirga lumbricoides TaxID=1046115 RepID=A0A2T4DRA8_9BACT|nr:hypothetical protein C9994_07805 [Marivirga lumbricoides]
MIHKDHDKIIIHRTLLNSTFRRFTELNSGLDPLDVKGFLDMFFRFLGSQHLDPKLINEDIVFILRIEDDQDSIKLIDPEEFTQILKKIDLSVINTFYVNLKGYDAARPEDGNFIENPRSNALSLFCKENALSAFRVKGRSVTIFSSDGQFIDDIQNVNTSKSAGHITHLLEPIENYSLLLKRHFKEDLLKEKTVAYWEKGRSPGSHQLVKKPEEVFNRALFRFLRDNVLMCSVLPEAHLEGGRDTIDIKVKNDETGLTYLFEIKWLGTCGTGSYGNIRANVGLKQIDIYVSESTEKVVGVLIIYDARKIKNPITYLSKIKDACHPNVRDPELIQLTDTTASKEAEKEVRK